jgi:HK97 family phage major capsid protein
MPSNGVFGANDPDLAKTGDSIFAGYLDPVQAQDYFAEAEKTSIVQRFARKIPMGPTGVKIPHWTGDVQAQWVGESEMKPITKGALSSQSVQPYKIATIFTASAEVVRANPANYLGTMRTKVATAIAMAFDAAVLHGTNAPSAFAHCLADTTKVQYLSGSNAYDAFAVEGLGQLVSAGKKWRSTLLDDTVEPLLNGAKDLNGRPLFLESPFSDQVSLVREGRIVGRPTVISDHVADGNVVGFIGDFDQVVWGQVGGLSFSVSDQATLNFGTPSAPELISLWQHNLVAVLVEAEYGLLVNDPESFVKLVTGPLDYTVGVGAASAGTFTIKVNGVETAAIAYNAAASAVKSAIVAVDDGLVASDVTVTGSAPTWTVSVPATLAAGTAAGLTSGTITVVSA